jgi:hypothetical protein
MSKPIKSALFWTPRILGILFTLFLGLFSLDVFGTGATFWETVAAFLIHNIPVFVLLVVLILAWRWEWVGAAAFIGFGIWYLILMRGQFFILALVPILIGGLFLLGWIWRKKIRG